MCPPLVVPGPGTCPIRCYWQRLLGPCVYPLGACPNPLFCLPSFSPQHSRHPASCLLAQFEGSPQLQTPNELGVVGGWERGEVGVWGEAGGV